MKKRSMFPERMSLVLAFLPLVYLLISIVGIIIYSVTQDYDSFGGQAVGWLFILPAIYLFPLYILAVLVNVILSLFRIWRLKPEVKASLTVFEKISFLYYGGLLMLVVASILCLGWTIPYGFFLIIAIVGNILNPSLVKRKTQEFGSIWK